MSELSPNKNTIEMVNWILEQCEEKGLTTAEVCDIPAELNRRINRNVTLLKQRPFSNLQ